MNTENLNEEIVEVVESIGNEISYSPNRSLKVMIGTGVIIATGAVTYRFAVKPLVKKVKTKIAEKRNSKQANENSEQEFDTEE